MRIQNNLSLSSSAECSSKKVKNSKKYIPSLVHIHEEMRLNLSAAADAKKIFMLTPEKSNPRKTRCANVNTRKWRFFLSFLFYLGAFPLQKKGGRFDIYIEHVADLTFDFSSPKVKEKALFFLNIFCTRMGLAL